MKSSRDLKHDPRFLAMTLVHLQTLIRANIESIKEVAMHDREITQLLDKIADHARVEGNKEKLQVLLLGLMKASDTAFQRRGGQREALKETLIKVNAPFEIKPRLGMLKENTFKKS